MPPTACSSGRERRGRRGRVAARRSRARWARREASRCGSPRCSASPGVAGRANRLRRGVRVRGVLWRGRAFARPQSTTCTTSPMVTEVSATLVLTTTLRVGGGGASNARRCSAGESEPCSGRTHAPRKDGRDRSAEQQRSISRAPERKTRMAPGSPAVAMCSTKCVSSAQSTSAGMPSRPPFAAPRPNRVSASTWVAEETVMREGYAAGDCLNRVSASTCVARGGGKGRGGEERVRYCMQVGSSRAGAATSSRCKQRTGKSRPGTRTTGASPLPSAR